MKPAKLANINHAWGHLVVEELKRNGVDYFCISPGSRSSPLTIAVAENKGVEAFMHFDERGAAFHALGYVSAARKPCALICTSGTAAANYFPAIIEASKKKLPLIVLTADRPPEIRLTGADQTIDQVKIFGDYVRYFMDVPCPTTDMKPEFILTTVDQAVYRAKFPMAGPVHLNFMFREPLAPVQSDVDLAEYLKPLEPWEKSETPFTHYTHAGSELNAAPAKEIQKVLSASESGIIVVGKLNGPKEQESVLKLAQKLRWPIFPDVTSGLRLGISDPNVVPYFDQCLLAEIAKVDTVLHLGGRITSKRWYQYIERTNPKNYIMVLNHPLRNDPLHNVTVRVEAGVKDFCDKLSGLAPERKNNFTNLPALTKEIDAVIETAISQSSQITEMGIARAVSKIIPNGHGLFLANSMPIRDMDMYADFKGKTVTIGANRGASGIDGLIATACGFSKGLNQPTTLVIGDMAVLHDLNSLSMVKKLKLPLTIVAINNNGSAIFSFLPIADFKNVFENYFGTPHGLHFEASTRMFGLNYQNPKTPKEFTDAYRKSVQSKQSTFIEVTTDRTRNYAAHKELQEKLKSTIAKNLNSTKKSKR